MTTEIGGNRPITNLHWADGVTTGGVSEPLEEKKLNGYNFGEKPDHAEKNWLDGEQAAASSWAKGAVIRRFTGLAFAISKTVVGDLFYVETGANPDVEEGTGSWELNTAAAVTSLSTDGEVIAYSRGDFVHLINADTRVEIWSRDMARLVTDVDVEGGDVAVGLGASGGGNDLFRLARVDGAIVDSASEGGDIIKLRIHGTDVIFIQDVPRRICKDDFGGLGVAVHLSFGVGADPKDLAISDNRAYVATFRETTPASDKVLWAVNLTTMLEVWSNTDGTFGALSVEADGLRVWRGNGDSAAGLECYRADDGTLLYSNSTLPTFSGVGHMAVDHARLFLEFQAGDDDLFCFNKLEGRGGVGLVVPRVYGGFPVSPTPSAINDLKCDGVSIIAALAGTTPGLKAYDTRRSRVLYRRTAGAKTERAPFYTQAVPVDLPY